MQLPTLGVPPLGLAHNFVDSLIRICCGTTSPNEEKVWAAAGTWNDNFGAAPADIVRIAGGVVTNLTRD